MSTEGGVGAGGFATTRWTVVLGAGAADGERSRVALEELCRTYWRPVYAFVRRQGRSTHDAQDLTQGFFERLLAGSDLARVDPALGRFRSFLLASMKHYLANDHDRAVALKRGGGVAPVSLDVEGAETALGLEADTGFGPDRVYDRQWALALLDRVLERLREEHVAAGKVGLFEQLRPTLSVDRASVSYAEMARRLGMTEGAVKVGVHRLRQRYRTVLREEVAATLADPALVEEELRDLFAALAT